MESTPEAAETRPPIGMPRIPPGLVPRARLLARLRAAPPLVVIRGPIASGKSALVAQWLRALDDPDRDIVWTSRDVGVVTRGSFWQPVLEALVRAGRLDAGVPDRVLGEMGDEERSRAALRRALERLERPLTLVVDNFGPPGDCWDQVSDDLLHVLRWAPALQVVAIGRSRTRLESVEAGLAIDRVMLLDEDLLVTLDELRAVAAGLGLAGASDEALERLADAADRLVYPVRYALESAARSGEAIDESLVRGLDDRLVEELEQAGLFEFAGPVALAPYLAVEVAQRLTGDADAAARLADLERRSLGAFVAMDGAGEVFRFTGRARTAIVAAYAAAYPEAARTARSALAGWFQARGEVGIAAELAIEAEDLPALERILLGAWAAVSREKGALVLRLVMGIDPDRILAHPVLSLFTALSLNARPGAQELATPYFRAAIEGGRRRWRRASAPEQFVFAVGESIAMRLTGDARGAHAAAVRAADADGRLRHDERESFAELYPLMLSQTGQSAFYAGDAAVARRAFVRAVEYGSRDAHATVVNGWYGALALIDVLEGRLAAARSLLERIDDEAWGETVAEGYSGAGRIIATAHLAIDAGECSRAVRELDRLAPHFTTIEHWAVIAAARALAMGLGGAPAEAGAELRRLLERRDDRVGSAGRAAREVADVDGVLELLELLEGGIVVEHGTNARPGRDAATSLALRAVRAVLAGRREQAVRLVGRAESTRVTPLQDMLVAIAGVVVARAVEEAGTRLEPFAIRIAMLVESESLHWPLALLSPGDRRALLGALGSSERRAAFETALQRVAPLPRPTGRTVVLSERERELLLALVTPATRVEIAAQRFVSVNTVRTQIASIYRKLGVGDREGAILRAVELGLLDRSALPAAQVR